MRLGAAFVLTGAALSSVGCAASSSDDVSSDSREGTIVVTQTFDGAVATSYEIDANWLPPAGASGCSLTTVGACTVVACSAATTSASTTSLDAGPLVFGSSSGESATLTAGVPANYFTQSSGSFFMPGDLVTVTGRGGRDLPPFAPLSVLAPAQTTLLEPACDAGNCPAFDRTRDLPLAWSSQGPGVLSIGLSDRAAAQSSDASCVFDLSAGSASVPADVLAMLPASDSITLTVQALNDTPFTLGGLPTAFLVAETIAVGDAPPARQ